MSFDAAILAAARAALVHLGGAVTYTPGVGDPAAVRGIFDATFVLVDTNSNAGVASEGPAVFLVLADLPSDPETDEDARVTVAGTTYRAHTVKKDGQGGVLLLLHET